VRFARERDCWIDCAIQLPVYLKIARVRATVLGVGVASSSFHSGVATSHSLLPGARRALAWPRGGLDIVLIHSFSEGMLP